MILDFKFLKYSPDTDSYRSVSVSLFNKKEIEQIQNIKITEDVESGDVIYRTYDFYTKIDVNQRDLKDYYINLMSNHGIVLANAKTPEKCTLFVENTDTISLFDNLQLVIQELAGTEQVIFRKIPVSSFRKRTQEERNFAIRVDGLDYVGVDQSMFESSFSQNDYFYIMRDEAAKGLSFENETLLKAYVVDCRDTFSHLPALLHHIAKSNYTVKLISAGNFVRSVKRLKKEITYDAYMQMKSLIGTQYEYTLTSLLDKYDFNFIVNQNYLNDPVSCIYMRLLKKTAAYAEVKFKDAINAAYQKKQYHIIQEYLTFINLSEQSKPDLEVATGVVFKPVFYYTWNKPNEVFEELNFKEYNEQESVE